MPSITDKTVPFNVHRNKHKGKELIEILPGKRQITWVLAGLLFSAEFQMEPLSPNPIYYCTSKKIV